MRNRRPAGFTLLEVVVALAILGISLATVLQIFSGGLKNIYRIDLAHRAMSHGENVMNEILTSEEISGPTQLSGDLDEDFYYSAEVEYWEAADEGLSLDLAAPNVHLLSVEVRVHFKQDRFGKVYQLQCLKAVPTFDSGPSVDTVDPLQQLFRRSSR